MRFPTCCWNHNVVKTCCTAPSLNPNNPHKREKREKRAFPLNRVGGKLMSSQRWPLAKTWTRWTKQAGLDVAGASGLTRKAILMDSGSMKDVLLVSGMR